MCNPRQVKITATQSLSAEWSATIERAAQVSGTVLGEARAGENLRDLLGPAAYACLVQGLSGDDNWIRDDDGYRFLVDGGEVSFFPETGELELVATLSEELVAQGRAERTMSGTVTAEASAEGVGEYDRWRGETKSEAREQARLEAERLAAADARTQLNDATFQAESQARARLRVEASRLEAEAQAAAEDELAARGERRREELEEQARARLETVREACLGEVRRAVGRAYQEAILAYAHRQGARNVLVSGEDGDTIDIQFEL